MPSKNVRRIGLYITPENDQRLKERLQAKKFSQAELFAAIITVATDQEIDDLLDRYRKTRELEITTAKALSSKMLQLVKGKSSKDLQMILDAANGAGVKS